MRSGKSFTASDDSEIGGNSKIKILKKSYENFYILTLFLVKRSPRRYQCDPGKVFLPLTTQK